MSDSLIFGFPGASWEISFQEIQNDLSISIEPYLLFQTKPWQWKSEGQSLVIGTETFARIRHMQIVLHVCSECSKFGVVFKKNLIYLPAYFRRE